MYTDHTCLRSFVSGGWWHLGSRQHHQPSTLSHSVAHSLVSPAENPHTGGRCGNQAQALSSQFLPKEGILLRYLEHNKTVQGVRAFHFCQLSTVFKDHCWQRSNIPYIYLKIYMVWTKKYPQYLFLKHMYTIYTSDHCNTYRCKSTLVRL